MRFSMLFSGELVLSFKQYILFYDGYSLINSTDLHIPFCIGFRNDEPCFRKLLLQTCPKDPFVRSALIYKIFYLFI